MQVINHLTTKELNLVLPKKRLSPRTVILKPGQSVLIGGLARLDFTEVRVLYIIPLLQGVHRPVGKYISIYHHHGGSQGMLTIG